MPQPKLISVKQGTQIVDLLCDSYVSCDVYGVCICMTVCRYIKSVTRSRLRDVLASATLHLQQLRNYIDVENLQPTDSLVLDFQRALDHVENSLDDLRRKYLNTPILKNFQDDSIDSVRGYKGSIVSLDWSREDGCYLFHVEYDSDSDTEDMELWKVKKYIVPV